MPRLIVITLLLTSTCLVHADLPFGADSMPMPHQTNPVFALAFSPDGKLLATAGSPWDEDPKVPGLLTGRGQLYIWNWRTFEKVVARGLDAAGAIPQYPFMTVAFSPDGKALIAGGTLTERIQGETQFWGGYYLYNVSDGIEIQISLRVRAKEKDFIQKRQLNRLWQMQLAPDGKGIAYASTRETVVINENYREGFQPRKGPTGTATCLAYSSDGRTLATGGGQDKLVRLLDVSPGKGISELTSLKHDAVVSWIAFTSDGKTLAATDDSGTLKLWDVDKRQERHTIQAHPGEIGGLAVSPDGKLVATGGDEKVIKLWDIATGKELKALPNQKGRIQALAFSPDSKILASSACDVGKEGEVRLWDVAKVLGANAGKE